MPWVARGEAIRGFGAKIRLFGTVFLRAWSRGFGFRRLGRLLFRCLGVVALEAGEEPEVVG